MDPRQKGRAPNGVRLGVPDAMGRMYMRVGFRTTELMQDPDISDWDIEELEHGYRRDRNGHFKGRPPKLVPLEVHKELARRKVAHVTRMMTLKLPMAIEALCAIAESPFSDENARIKAIGMIMDRVMGKTPEKLQVGPEDGTPPWLEALKAGIVDIDDDGVIEANAVEVDDELLDDELLDDDEELL